MSAPISFTLEEQSALERVDRLSKAIARTDAEIAAMNRRILREKAKKDQLVARKASYEARIREALNLIDTAKQKQVGVL